MAQVFTLEFIFRHFVHTAVFTIRSSGSDHSITAQLIGTDLADIVPDGELNFRLSNASRQPVVAKRPGYNELEQSLREAVTRHLRSATVLK
jgi:hypothetical protein